MIFKLRLLSLLSILTLLTGCNNHLDETSKSAPISDIGSHTSSEQILSPIKLIEEMAGNEDLEKTVTGVRNEPCYYPDSPDVIAPTWICNNRNSPQLVSEIGMAPASSAGVSFSKSMAIANARIKLARRLQQHEAGKLNETDLKHSKVLDVQRSPAGGYYARVGVRL